MMVRTIRWNGRFTSRTRSLLGSDSEASIPRNNSYFETQRFKDGYVHSESEYLHSHSPLRYTCSRTAKRKPTNTVLNHSIRQALWPVTTTTKFWFRHITIYGRICKLLRVPRPIFGCFGADFRRFCCDPCDLSSNREGLWPVTAELNDLVQYTNTRDKLTWWWRPLPHGTAEQVPIRLRYSSQHIFYSR